MQNKSLDLKKGISIAIKIPYLIEEEKMTQTKLYLQQIEREGEKALGNNCAIVEQCRSKDFNYNW